MMEGLNVGVGLSTEYCDDVVSIELLLEAADDLEKVYKQFFSFHFSFRY